APLFGYAEQRRQLVGARTGHRISRYPSATIGIGESPPPGAPRPAMALEETKVAVTVDPAHYREAMAHFATGVAVVTSRDLDGERHGMTANAVTSVSLSPVLLLVCIANHLPTHRAVRETGRFNINLLRAAQRDLAQQFAHPAADKF